MPEGLQEAEAYKASAGENLNGSPCGYIMASELCLPGDFLFLFQCTQLRGQEVVVGSTEALLANLHNLNERTFRARPRTAARWLSGGWKRPRTTSRPTPAAASPSSSTSPKRP